MGKSKDDREETTVKGMHLGSSSASASEKLEAFLGKGCRVAGTLTFSGPVQIDGYVEGEITAQDRLIIGEGAVVQAKINGGEVLVKGTVNGDIIASQRLTLKKPARVVGNITAGMLTIEEGVIFEGKCSMDNAAKNPEGGVK